MGAKPQSVVISSQDYNKQYKENTNLNITIIIQSAIEGTFEWSGVNSMILNTEKTVMNTNISNKISPNSDF